LIPKKFLRAEKLNTIVHGLRVNQRAEQPIHPGPYEQAHPPVNRAPQTAQTRVAVAEGPGEPGTHLDPVRNTPSLPAEISPR
jgi:hypothetical protein